MHKKAVFIGDDKDLEKTREEFGHCQSTANLQYGKVYEIEREAHFAWHSKIWLKGVRSGLGFNSASFITYGEDSACFNCEVENCDLRGDPYNEGQEAGFDCLAAK